MPLRRPSSGRRLPLLLLSVCACALILVALLPTAAVARNPGVRHSRSGADVDGVPVSGPGSAPPAAGQISTGTNSTLVCVQVVSRHGTRAPNPVVSKLCPADRSNLALYAHMRITLAGLTGTGMHELWELGEFTRQQYIERTYPGFISNYFNDQQVYFRAVGEDRTLQSAAAMGQGMFPAGTTPLGYRDDLPSPVPVYTLPDVYDSLLEVRKYGCKARLARDAAKWDATRGIELYKANQPLLAQLHRLCNITDLNDRVAGGSGGNYGDAIKDITDAWTFDMMEGFPLEDGLNVTSLLALRSLAVEQLLGRILGTDEQVTYLNGELPERMLDNFLFSVWNQGPEHVAEFALRLYAYHGHREMIYALAAFLGLEFDIPFPALPRGAIPPGTTLFFELHYVGEREADGAIPNAFEAAGLVNPYAEGLEGGEVKLADPLSEEELPWELRRRTASDIVREQDILHRQHDQLPVAGGAGGAAGAAATKKKEGGDEEEKNKKGDEKKSSSGAPTPASITSLAEQEQERAVQPGALKDSGMYGSDQLRREHDSEVAFNQTSGSGQGHKKGKKRTQGGSESKSSVTGGGEEPNVVPPLAPANSEAQYKYMPRARQPGQPESHGHAAPTWKPAPPMNGYVVRALLWHPCKDEAGAKAEGKDSQSGGKQDDTSVDKKQRTGDPSTPDCPAVPIAMTAVCDSPAESGCTLQQLSDAINLRVSRTGSWSDLCAAEDVRRIMADVRGVSKAAAEVEEEDEEEGVDGEQAEGDDDEDASDDALDEVRSGRAARAPQPTRRTGTRGQPQGVTQPQPAVRTPTRPPSHPILRSFLLLLLLAPLSVVAYLLYMRYRRSEYDGMRSLSGRADRDIEVQIRHDEEKTPFVR